MPRNPKKRPLTTLEAQRAIYIDFEGNKKALPTLLGVLYTPDPTESDPEPTSVFEQWIVESAFKNAVSLEGNDSFKGFISLPELAIRITRQAKVENRCIVSWSEHDYKLLKESLGTTGGSKAGMKALRSLELRYRDAKRAGKRWTRRDAEASVPDQRLATYMKLVNFRVPDEYGVGVTGSTLNTVRKSLARHNDEWSKLTALSRKRFDNVLRHNEYDLKGMREVVRHATMPRPERTQDELLELFDSLGHCVSSSCSTCGGLAGKERHLRDFIASTGNLPQLLGGISAALIEERSINVHLLVAPLAFLTPRETQFVLRRWARTHGALSSPRVAELVTMEYGLMSITPPAAQSRIRKTLDAAIAARPVPKPLTEAELLLCEQQATAREQFRLAAIQQEYEQSVRLAALAGLPVPERIARLCNDSECIQMLGRGLQDVTLDEMLALPSTVRHQLLRQLNKVPGNGFKRLRGALHRLGTAEIALRRRIAHS